MVLVMIIVRRIYDSYVRIVIVKHQRLLDEENNTGSYNGSTDDFDSSNAGSSPAPVARSLLLN